MPLRRLSNPKVASMYDSSEAGFGGPLPLTNLLFFPFGG